MKFLFTVFTFAFLFVGCYPIYKRVPLKVETQSVEFESTCVDAYSKILEWAFLNDIDLDKILVYENRNVISGTNTYLLDECKIFNEPYYTFLTFDFFIRVENKKVLVFSKNPLITYRNYKSSTLSEQTAKPFYYAKCNCSEEVETKMNDFAKSLQSYLVD